jgi:polyphenol oxidase
MKYDASNNLFQFEGLALKHAITTRRSFNSKDFNLSYTTGEFGAVSSNRARLQSYFEGGNFLTIPQQCHQAQIFKVVQNSGATAPADTDALVTNVKGHVLGVLSADCVPLLLYDPVKDVLGLAHAGWKGTVASIGPLTVAKMVDEYGCNAKTIRAFIGPSISQTNFEVGSAVAAQFYKLDLGNAVVEDGGKAKVDLWRANALLLARAGLQVANIDIANMCTVVGVENFYSARKEGFETGRFGVFAMLS